MSTFPQHCTGCGQRLYLSSSATWLVVCPACHQINTHGQRMLRLQPQTGKPLEDLSLLQLGTQGKINQKSFKIIGRIQIIYQQVCRNLWFARSDQDDTSWIGEWEGGYAKLTYHKFQKQEGLFDPNVGEVVGLFNVRYQLRRVNVAETYYLEGELPELDIFHIKYLTSELGNAREGVALFHQFTAAEAEAFIGSFETFEHFTFTGLRQMNETKGKQALGFPVKNSERTCPSCSKQIPKILYHQAHIVACPHCLNIHNHHLGKLTPRTTTNKINKKNPWIPIGKTAKLKGISYTVVGFMVGKENRQVYQWREYVLYHPVQGYAFLNEYDGHWNVQRFVGDINHNVLREQSVDYQGRTYKKFNQYRTKVLYAEGEFPWNILDKETVSTEYIAPPYILTKLDGQDEISYIHGEYITTEEISSAFALTTPAPVKVGKGATEPFSPSLPFKKVLWSSGLGVLLLLILYTAFSMNSKKTVLLNEIFTITASQLETNPEPFSTPITIHADGFSTTDLRCKLDANVVNSWFAIAVVLINQANGQEYSFDMGVEYYAGYADGERWSEGSKEADKYLSALPEGKYHMLIYPYLPPGGKITNFAFRVEEDVPIASNFWMVFLLIALYPTIHGIRKYFFEKARWSNSNYSPYES